MNEYKNFGEWLVLNSTLAQSSIDKYKRALKKITNHLIESNIINSSLEEINNCETLEKIKNNYFSIPENRESDKKGNQMYSAAFNRFITYKGNQGSTPVASSGIVYILSNPSMPGLVKIGKTTNLSDRMSQLYKTGVPEKFKCVYAKKVDNYSEVEKYLHKGLLDKRVNPNREFFKISENQAVNLLKMLPGEDVTIIENNSQAEEEED
tara:strand:- start:14 stop:637 length:624 start_codon:yes stop_codon:yes gene_type:complete